ncbi:hypothetical protein MTP10_06550 [Nonomuraea sp. 3-1Str]|uniref:hypothetical protein n=1 Tax=unclassified Nonomuraea TaxID=2593643 RepID=UPI00285C8F5F|nr:hypothetical protein [Nonomuraea sp. 3-1Str]MDR8408392.1 hypothetical protein [Nonomuraea sp. 3-1Str]
MIRRILAGAAIAGIALGFSAAAASADSNPYNSGQSWLSQWSALNNATVLNGVLNDSVKDVNVLNIGQLDQVDVAVLNNG